MIPASQDLLIVGQLAAVTFLIGLLIGFVGAGGAGIAVAILTAGFDLPTHTAIGTAIVAMFFVTISGAVSHLREGNVAQRLGLVVGLSGAAGAVLGADTSQAVDDQTLATAAGLALWGLAALMWLRTRLTTSVSAARELVWPGESVRPPREWLAGIGLGATGGVAAAFFGVGMAPFLQLGLLTVHHLPLRQTAGTTMLVLVFISASGGAALARHGDVSLPHLVGLTIGLASGAYIGARFTRRAPRWVLRSAVVAIPFIAGAMLLFL
ncbi:MAG TPA: sulfite exporter TauE/SafE family protein [Thermomicrobiales bacterium]|nr:sulfite exporter TauE/SafE family protein [Thermomicrobiales bacterium]